MSKEIKKESAKKQIVKEKQKEFFDVVVDAIMPCKITYRVFAESEEDAIKMSEKSSSHKSFKPLFNKRKVIKICVYKAGTTTAKLTKLTAR